MPKYTSIVKYVPPISHTYGIYEPCVDECNRDYYEEEEQYLESITIYLE
jgi:hypothetical protein